MIREPKRPTMPSRLRAFALVAGLALFASCGCEGSHNKGKIEGRWQVVAAGERTDPPEYRDTFLIFGDDGTVLLQSPAVPPSADKNAKPPGWRYKLLGGDAADFYDLSAEPAHRLGMFAPDGPSARVTIRLEVITGGKYEGREMTLTDADGKTLKLNWLR